MLTVLARFTSPIQASSPTLKFVPAPLLFVANLSAVRVPESVSIVPPELRVVPASVGAV